MTPPYDQFHIKKLKHKFTSVWCLLFTIFGFSQVGYFTGSNQQNLPTSIMSDLDDVLVPVIHSAANNQRVRSLSIELLFKVLRLLWQTQLPDISSTLIPSITASKMRTGWYIGHIRKWDAIWKWALRIKVAECCL